MNPRHRKILHRLFAHPVSANIWLRTVEAVFQELSAEADSSPEGRLPVKLNDASAAFPHASHDLPMEKVLKIRRLLIDTGVDPGTQDPL